MGVLENCCNETFVLASLAPPLARRKNVDASNGDGCSGIVLLVLEQDEL